MCLTVIQHGLINHFSTLSKSFCCLTLQQEGVGGSAHINLLDVIVSGHRVVAYDKSRDVAWRSNMGDCPCHPDVVRTHPSKLQIGGSRNHWRNEELKDLDNTEKTLQC